MQQAAISLYGTSHGVVTTHLYIRIKPQTEEQLKEISNSEDVFFDYPLDYELIQDGDYYPQPNITENEIPWLYTVVEANFTPPPNFTNYEVLQQLYISDDFALENEALRLTGNPIEQLCGGQELRMPVPCTVDPTGPGCPLEFEGGGGGGTNGGTRPPGRKTPAGFIRVRDTNFNEDMPVRRTRVIARRFLKIDKTYTNDAGYFRCTKSFNNKVTVVVKFRSQNAETTTRALTGARFWQMWFPIKHNIGKFSGTLNNIQYTFLNDLQTGDSKRNLHWWAAQWMNSFYEYKAMATAENIASPPTNTVVLLSTWTSFRGSGSAVMNNHLLFPTVSSILVNYYVASPGAAAQATLMNFLYNGAFMRGIDITLGSDVIWKSDKVKALMYHEITHAAHFTKVGDSWWNNLVAAEIYTIAAQGGNPPNPYGNGTDGAISDIIAITESWAEHIGHWFADAHYGLLSTRQRNQYVDYDNNGIVNGLSSHLNLLEDFSPFRTTDEARWIPYGIHYDMIDDRNDQISLPFRVNVDDAVLNFTNQQLFNAIDNTTNSIGIYRNKLLLQNPLAPNQNTQINSLFTDYGY